MVIDDKHRGTCASPSISTLSGLGIMAGLVGNNPAYSHLLEPAPENDSTECTTIYYEDGSPIIQYFSGGTPRKEWEDKILTLSEWLREKNDCFVVLDKCGVKEIDELIVLIYTNGECGLFYADFTAYSDECRLYMTNEAKPFIGDISKYTLINQNQYFSIGRKLSYLTGVFSSDIHKIIDMLGGEEDFLRVFGEFSINTSSIENSAKKEVDKELAKYQ